MRQHFPTMGLVYVVPIYCDNRKENVTFMKMISIRELQLKELEILKDFDEFCHKHSLKYCLAGGTLLGAVRHHGFIPWDDDIDVLMPRPDYIRFNQLYNSKYLLKSPLIDKQWHYPFAKLMNTNIALREVSSTKVTYVWIDVFPADGWPSSYDESVKYHQKHLCLTILNGASNGMFMKSKHGMWRTFIKFALIGLLRFLPDGVISRYIDHSVSKKFPYNESKYVGNIVWPGGRMIRSKKDFFDCTTRLQFEDSQFNAPKDYHDYLMQAYGDYMKMPPESERIGHPKIIL